LQRLTIGKLYSNSSEDGWSVHQCSFGGALQSVILLAYSEDVSALRRRLEDALQLLGVDLGTGDLVHASYLDFSIKEEWDAQSFGGKIPCRSIWGSTGQRLAAVLILDVF
jgi:diphthine-ammonia ligase